MNNANYYQRLRDWEKINSVCYRPCEHNKNPAYCFECLKSENAVLREENDLLEVRLEGKQATLNQACQSHKNVTVRAKTAEAKLTKTRTLPLYGLCGRQSPYVPKMVLRADGEWIKASDLAAILNCKGEE
ncbi:MAG: hypothetical protein BA863_10310 [Desulfovibrio sp. S3730MH75]|nr:MAG: hypothetical protein BA863_10310 [Desulfovibrio sp. S3730MH75]